MGAECRLIVGVPHYRSMLCSSKTYVAALAYRISSANIFIQQLQQVAGVEETVEFGTPIMEQPSPHRLRKFDSVLNLVYAQ